MRVTTAALSLVLALHVLAAPVERDSTITPITAATISSYSPYTTFAAAAYCGVAADWTCMACQLVPDFVPYAYGGDGDGTPMWYVGWWPSGNSVVVAHEGTDPTKFLSLLTDANVFTGPLDPTLFPGMPSTVKVHDGFRNAHANAAPSTLAAVQAIIAENSATQVIVTGHSLGGALAALDAAYFTLNLPASISIKAITYGQPRVGNQDFANWIDQNISDFSRITNMHDMIPIVPGRALGFHHASGEKHIISTGLWDACAGQDNTSVDCSTGAVLNIFDGSIGDHLGPYEGVWMGTNRC